MFRLRKSRVQRKLAFGNHTLQGLTPDFLALSNTKAMTMFFAGGGAKPGLSVGTTDELGWRAVEKVYCRRDVHATILHLMGLNDMRLMHYQAGRNMRLTDTGGEIIRDAVA